MRCKDHAGKSFWKSIASLAALSLSVAFASTSASALHFDVLVGTSGGPNAGSTLTVGFYGDTNIGTIFGNPSLAGLQPIDKATGMKMFPGNFGDPEGGPLSTDDPGFQGFNGALGAGEEIWFKGIGNLQRWEPSTGQWSTASNGEGIRLYGGIPPEVATNYLLDPTNPTYEAALKFYEGGTLFTGGGVTGPTSAIIDDASSAGGFHAHLDWFLEPAGGSTLAPGAYTVQLQMFSSATVGGAAKYQESEPFMVMFNYGLDNTSFSTALASRVVEVPEPHQVILMGLGLAVLGVAKFRRRRITGG